VRWIRLLADIEILNAGNTGKQGERATEWNFAKTETFSSASILASGRGTSMLGPKYNWIHRTKYLLSCFKINFYNNKST